MKGMYRPWSGSTVRKVSPSWARAGPEELPGEAPAQNTESNSLDARLLIRDQKILAGRSSKKEKAYMAAVRRPFPRQGPPQKSDSHRAAEVQAHPRHGTTEAWSGRSPDPRLPPPRRSSRSRGATQRNPTASTLPQRSRSTSSGPSIEVKRNYPKRWRIRSALPQQQIGLVNAPRCRKTVSGRNSQEGNGHHSEAALTQRSSTASRKTTTSEAEEGDHKEHETAYHIEHSIALPYGTEFVAASTKCRNTSWRTSLVHGDHDR
jgi:hypothetical protein